MVATGSPFDPVVYKGKTYTVSQCNNAFIFPGLTLGMVASKARRMTYGMMKAAYEALTTFNMKLTVPGAMLPALEDISQVNYSIAVEVAK